MKNTKRILGIFLVIALAIMISQQFSSATGSLKLEQSYYWGGELLGVSNKDLTIEFDAPVVIYNELDYVYEGYQFEPDEMLLAYSQGGGTSTIVEEYDLWQSYTFDSANDYVLKIDYQIRAVRPEINHVYKNGAETVGAVAQVGILPVYVEKTIDELFSRSFIPEYNNENYLPVKVVIEFVWGDQEGAETLNIDEVYSGFDIEADYSITVEYQKETVLETPTPTPMPSPSSTPEPTPTSDTTQSAEPSPSLTPAETTETMPQLTETPDTVPNTGGNPSLVVLALVMTGVAVLAVLLRSTRAKAK